MLAYNGFLGLLLLLGALALRFSGPPDLLGGLGFALVVASSVILVGALVVPMTRGSSPPLLAAQGAVIVALTVGFAFACAVWARDTLATGSFGYLPGLIVVGTSYGAALWADFGPARARPRPWRLAGFIAGIVLDAVVAVFVVGALLRQ